MSGVSRYNEVRKQMEVLEMFRHKAEKRIVELGSEQLRLAKHALLAFRNKLIAQGKPVICMTMIDLLERIKRTYSATGGSESDVLKIYKTVPLLVIDDIGKEPPTEWAISTVYNIINGRYEAYLPTIVTTNYDTEALIDRMTPRESHDSMTARATIDRLMEMCRGITLTGQSWRSR